jgi:hypothetical protein
VRVTVKELQRQLDAERAKTQALRQKVDNAADALWELLQSRIRTEVDDRVADAIDDLDVSIR